MSEKKPIILFKLPSRGRPERFFKALDSIVNNLATPYAYHISCTLDEDDPTMNNPHIKEKIEQYKNTSISWGLSKSKIDAVNRGMPDIEWDILCIHSDDMLWEMYGFDEIIRTEFGDNFDMLLHIPDNDAKDLLATYYIAGKEFYSRFGYVYNPQFKSLWCDNLVMDISKILGCYKYAPYHGMIFHSNPSYGHYPKDEMFISQQLDWEHDEKVYREIKNRGYDIEKFKNND